jgi:cephalosporin hydroxylase
MSDGFLHRYYLSNTSKLIEKWFHYFDIYERHFTRFRNKSPVMLEIGVQGGGSLAMWKAFFGEGSRIIGVDIDPSCKAHEAEGIEVFIGSQDDPALINRIFEKYPHIDIVLDDGSHLMWHMRASFELIYERVDPYGLYMVEDTHTSYLPAYQGGLREPGSFMEFVKGKLDELNALYTGDALPVSAFTKSTACVACYDSIVVFERKPQGIRNSASTGMLWPG